MSNWDFDAPQFYDFNKPNEGSGDEWFDKKAETSKNPIIDTQSTDKENKNSQRRSIKRHSTISKASKKNDTIVSKPPKRNSLRLQKKIAILKSCTQPKSPKLNTTTRICNAESLKNVTNTTIANNMGIKKNNTSTYIKKQKITTTLPFSFETKDKLIKEKKEKAIKDKLEQEQLARNFKAKPIPNALKKIYEGKERPIKTPTRAKPFKSHVDARLEKKNSAQNQTSVPSASIRKSPAAKREKALKKTFTVTKCKEFTFATDRRAQKRKENHEEKEKK